MSLSGGDSFWIVVGEPNEFWPSYLDWCLNFQFSRWKNREEAELAPELKAILLEEDLTPLNVPKTNPNQCLVAARHLLPCDFINFFSCKTEEIQSWLPQSAQIWRGLKKPSLRIFAGPGAHKNSALKKEIAQYFEGRDIKMITEQSLTPRAE